MLLLAPEAYARFSLLQVKGKRERERGWKQLNAGVGTGKTLSHPVFNKLHTGWQPEAFRESRERRELGKASEFSFIAPLHQEILHFFFGFHNVALACVSQTYLITWNFHSTLWFRAFGEVILSRHFNFFDFADILKSQSLNFRGFIQNIIRISSECSDFKIIKSTPPVNCNTLCSLTFEVMFLWYAARCTACITNKMNDTVKLFKSTKSF